MDNSMYSQTGESSSKSIYSSGKKIGKISTSLAESQLSSLKRMMDGTSIEIQESIDESTLQMSSFQKKGAYSEAEKVKVKIEQMKKCLTEKKLQECLLKHQKEQKQLKRSHEAELEAFTNKWNGKQSQAQGQASQQKSDLQNRHSIQMDDLKKELLKQLPQKIKESSECLNLRKVQEQLAKQKKFSEAEQIHSEIEEMERREKVLFKKMKVKKTQTHVQALQSKQKADLAALQKRTMATLNELFKEKEQELSKLNLKYLNTNRDMKAQQGKEILMEKGWLKSGGRRDSSKSLTKSKSISRLFNSANGMRK